MPVCTESGTDDAETEIPEGTPLAAGTSVLWDGTGEAGVSVCVPGDGTGDAGSKAGEADGVLSVGAGEEEMVGAPDGDGAAVLAGVPVAEGTGEVVFSGAKETIGGSVGSV